MKDGGIDYTSYSASELREALARVRKDLYPKNHENLLAALAAKQARADANAGVIPVATASPPPPRVVDTAVQGSDPYRPPSASLEAPMGTEAGALRYAGFWRRFGALWIDALILSPLIGITLLLAQQTRMANLYWFLPGLAISLLYHVTLVRRFGGTPGTRILGMRMAMVDGAPVTLRAALLRHSVLFVLTLLSSVAMVLATLEMTDEEYFALGFLARTLRLVELAPDWYPWVSKLSQAWVWGEFVSMLFNRKRRAVQDFIGGTIVVFEGREAAA